MKLLPRFFLSHLLAATLSLAALYLGSEVLAPRFYQAHVEEMVRAMGPAGAALQADLDAGYRQVLSQAFLASLPLAVLVAGVAAYAAARSTTGAIFELLRQAQEIRRGHYERRASVSSRDEVGFLADEFNRMAESLQNLERSRRENIGTVAHELRTPLAGLKGYLEALADGVLPLELATARMTGEVAAMEKLADDLSLVSSVEAGQVKIDLKPWPARELLSAAYERFASLAIERGVRLLLAASELPLVWADSERMGQVFSNLVANSLRYTKAGGEIRLEARPVASGVEFAVVDSGTGIDPKDLPYVFDRFYRADPARSRAEGGHGVGLTVAKGLVEAMGGRIEIASVPGEGTAVRFWLRAV
jgi:signal transduction histidine kinase